jgi:hypothetical protein
VFLRFAPGATLDFSSAENEMVAQDHVNCLYRLRHCDVEESKLFDRLDGQLALAKFVIEADRPPDVDADVAWHEFTGVADCVHEAMEVTPAARVLFLNRALNEVECEPVDVEGQRPIGLLAETTRVGYIEAYFDHRRWGEEALSEIVRTGALRNPALTGVNLLHVEEGAALDTR